MQRRRRKRRFWVRQLYLERKRKGEYHTLVQEAKLFDHEVFFKMFRMLPYKFEELLRYVAPSITKHSKREAIGPGERLSVTLRYLVTGDSYNTIAASYRMSDVTVGRIVRETCKVIFDQLLLNGYLKCPKNPNEWRQTALGFENQWNFPNCTGAIDGKHIIIQCPGRGGSMFFNYKKFHSIVLMAVVDSMYQFIMVDVGDYGRLSDGSVFASSKLGRAIINNTLNLPKSRAPPRSKNEFPYVFVGDAAFPLRSNLIKPYPRGSIELPESIANYRISRARRIVENAFGIATSRFRVFRRAICADVDAATQITKAVVALHNFLMADRSSTLKNLYCPKTLVDNEGNGEMVPGEWRNEENIGLQNSSTLGSNNYTRDAKNVRDAYRDYFNSPEGAVPWQMNMVTRTYDIFDEL